MKIFWMSGCVRLGDERITKEPHCALISEGDRKCSICAEPTGIPMKKRLGFRERASRWTARRKVCWRTGDDR